MGHGHDSTRSALQACSAIETVEEVASMDRIAWTRSRCLDQASNANVDQCLYKAETYICWPRCMSFALPRRSLCISDDA